jgi:tetratricopeptide (TPR) repeat protein
VKDELIKTLQIGVNLSNEDKFDEAIKEFDKIAELYNAMVQALIQRGRSHWEMKRWDLATEDFNKAQAMDPTNMDIPWTMALMNLRPSMGIEEVRQPTPEDQQAAVETPPRLQGSLGVVRARGGRSDPLLLTATTSQESRPGTDRPNGRSPDTIV